MSYLLFFVVLLVLIYFFYDIFVIRKENALLKMRNSKEIKILEQLGKINVKNYDLKKVVRILSIGNAFIISTISTVIIIMSDYIKNFYIWILVGAIMAFIVLIPFIILVYKLIGKILKKERSK